MVPLRKKYQSMVLQSPHKVPVLTLKALSSLNPSFARDLAETTGTLITKAPNYEILAFLRNPTYLPDSTP